MTKCPSGHDSTDNDFCSTCGAEVAPSVSPGGASVVPTTVVAPKSAAATTGGTGQNCPRFALDSIHSVGISAYRRDLQSLIEYSELVDFFINLFPPKGSPPIVSTERGWESPGANRQLAGLPALNFPSGLTVPIGSTG